MGAGLFLFLRDPTMPKKMAATPSDVDRLVIAIEALTVEIRTIGERLAPSQKPSPTVKRKPKRTILKT
jgi:hypothetical protein